MSSGGRQNLHSSIIQQIEQSEKDGGLFLKDVPARHVINAHTRNSLYQIAVIDGESGEAALRGGKHFPNAEIVRIFGSTWGGSMTKMRWVGINMSLAFFSSGARIDTSGISRIVVENNPELWDELVSYAKEHTPEAVVVTREEFEESIRILLSEKLPEEKYEAAMRMITPFSPNGKACIASVLLVAEEHGKFEACTEIIQRFYREHWGYQHPEICGDPAYTRVNLEYLLRVYRELELPLPNQD